MHYSKEKWTLYHNGELTEPRAVQIEIINEILTAIDQGYKNIILEAGTGIGKSVCATTISNYFDNSYIITMTNQLLQQYLHDFDYMIEEIKGRANYHCNNGGTCEECDVVKLNQEMFENYVKALKQYKENPEKYAEPVKPKKLKKCPDCPYAIALKSALACDDVITNYDFLHYAGNYAKILPDRDLIIFDESHNFEKKVMQLIVKTFNRKTIYKEYQFDIFDGITEHKMTLKDIQQSSYWIGVCEKIISIVSNKKKSYIKLNYSNIDSLQVNQLLKEDETAKTYDNTIKKYDEIIKTLKEDKWIIETPTKKQILADETYLTGNKEKGLTVELKPLTISEYTDTLLHFGDIRLFMTGTLGSKDMFCKWIGIDPNETYYIYKKSPFPVENRPIIRDYTCKMSGRNKATGEPNWKNDDALLKIYDILEDHPNEKGVIHVSSNEQAWFIVNELKGLCHRYFKVAYGANREQHIRDFEDDEGNMVLVGAGIKDGIDLKHDKCRFQIIYKMPFPSLAGTQINIRKRYDPVWYIYQTVMPLMQAYGRGIRDKTDWCKTYVLDSDFDNLLRNYHYLFNEYFLEAVEGLVIERPRRVKRVPRKQKMEAK